MENVPEDRNNPEFKLFVARLYNGGIKATVLQREFGVDRKTMNRWGDALKSDDAQLLVRALAGRGGHRKLTPEIQSYVEIRFPSIYQETRYEYSKRIRQEIERVFGQTISAETLRPLFKRLKKEVSANSELSPQEGDGEKGETACDYERAHAEEPSLETVENPAIERSEVNPDEPHNRKESPVLGEEGPQKVTFCHHLGLLVFSGLLLKVQGCVEKGGWLLKQWLAAILLGAVNIERTKFLDFGDLEMLLGHTLRFPHTQRVKLTEMASVETFERLVQFNAQGVQAAAYSDFYYDPHTKHYTGMKKVLQGWCSSIRFADKALHMDFIHTAGGNPVYIEHVDNYEDLRARFLKTLERFRSILEIDEKRVLTIILDRGIYSQDVFNTIINNERYHIITWEKGYKPVLWEEHSETGSFILERSRNRAADIRTYRFAYIDQKWEKNNKMRQLSVQATNPKGKKVQVSILTDDLERKAEEVICFMFKRWIQENDFKYLDTHFGINQITSYAATPYKRLKNEVEQRQIKSGQYKALEESRRQVRTRLGRLLFKEHQHPGRSEKRQKQIHELTQQYKDLQEQMAQTQKEVSRLESLIEQEYVRLDMRNKRLMDMLKLMARNAFYKALEPFKRMYDNYRDDHALFRNLTQAHGIIIQQIDEVRIILFPTVNYPPKLRRIVEQILDQINSTTPIMPDGSGRHLRLCLGEKAGFQLAIVSESND